MIDNSPSCFSLQKENGIPIPTWTGDQNDKMLLNLIDILIFLSNVNDVRKYIPQFVIQNRIYLHNAAMLIKEYERNQNQEKLGLVFTNSPSTSVYNTPSQNFDSPSRQNQIDNPTSDKRKYLDPSNYNEIVSFHQVGYPKDDYIRRIQFEDSDPNKRSFTPSPKVPNYLNDNNSYYYEKSSNLGLSNIYQNTPSPINSVLPQNMNIALVNSSGKYLSNSMIKPIENPLKQMERPLPNSIIKPQSSYIEAVNFNQNVEHKNFNRVFTNPLLNHPEDNKYSNRLIADQQMKRNLLPNRYIAAPQPQFQIANNIVKYQRPIYNIPVQMPLRYTYSNPYAQQNFHPYPLNIRNNNMLNGRNPPLILKYPNPLNKRVI